MFSLITPNITTSSPSRFPTLFSSDDGGRSGAGSGDKGDKEEGNDDAGDRDKDEDTRNGDKDKGEDVPISPVLSRSSPHSLLPSLSIRTVLSRLRRDEGEEEGDEEEEEDDDEESITGVWRCFFMAS